MLTYRDPAVTAIAARIFGDRQHFWDAYQQGQLARETGEARDSNPWDKPISRTHANCGDWYRGWDAGA